jgi:hypothetical protein
MTLSKAQIEIDKLRFRKWFWIWERDLLECARQFPMWLHVARGQGFTDEKIMAPWTHGDEGRHIRYMENPWFEEAT